MSFRAHQRRLEDTRVRLALRENHCPDCGNWGFLAGPRGAAARNIFCANPACRAAFNVTPANGDLAFVQRIGKAGENYYPPKVHVLRHGYALCGFAMSLPCNWPIGHCWVGVDEASDATCPVCRNIATQSTRGDNHVGKAGESEGHRDRQAHPAAKDGAGN